MYVHSRKARQLRFSREGKSMFSRLARTILVLSAMAPVALTYSWLLFYDEKAYWAWPLLGACLALVMFCVGILAKARHLLEQFPFQPTSVEPADRENLAFLILYLSPLFTAQVSDVNLALVIPALAIFALLTATGYNYHFNPLLGLVGWHFYKVSSPEGITYVILTKKQLRNTDQIRDVAQLTEYILIDLGN